MAGKNISKAALVEAGFAAVEEHGLDGLTMRDVADRLGVRAPAIYWHVKGRAELIDEMATEMWRNISAAVTDEAGDVDSVEAFIIFARVLRRHALRRRDGARLIAGTYLTDDALLRSQQTALSGVDRTRAQALVTAYTLVYSFAIGYLIEEQARLADPSAYDPVTRADRIGDPDVQLSALVLATGDERFEQLLALVMIPVRQELLG